MQWKENGLANSDLQKKLKVSKEIYAFVICLIGIR